jgi:iron complex transport system permease protein
MVGQEISPGGANDRLRATPRPTAVLFILAAVVVLAFLVYVNVGSYAWYTPWQIAVEIFRGPGGSDDSTIVWQIRLPRACECLLVGAILGVVGSAFQAQFRNPLADPYIVGVSSGAAIGGVLALIFGLGGILGGLGTSISGFVFGMLSLALVVALARHRGVIDVTSLLLSGVVIGSMLSALLSLALYAAGADTNQIMGWLLGSMTEAMWNKVAILASAALIGTVLLVRETRRMNALAMGEDEARRLGVDAGKLRNTVLTVGTAMVSAAVGTVGIVGFLGLVAPHIARRLTGVDWRWSLPAAGLVGAGLMLVSDLFAQRGMAALTHRVGLEVPVGAVTAFLGAPTLLILLRRSPT